MDDGISFRETVANWTGQVYQALKEIDKWHDRFERRFRDTDRSNGKRFQELDDKIDAVKDQLKDFIREELRREKDEILRIFFAFKKEQKKEMCGMKKKINSIWVKVVALGTSIGLLVGFVTKLILDKVM